jgi:replicative DNA helicase
MKQLQRSLNTVNERIEQTILRNLFRNDDYFRKVLPFIKSEYYEELNEKIIFEEIRKFADKYDRLPTTEVVLIEVEGRDDVSDQTFGEVRSVCKSFQDVVEDPTKDWLLDATEKWCKDRAIYLALMQSIKLADGKDEQKSRDSIPDILKEALSVSFDDHIGHDYLEDYEERFDFYTKNEDRIPFDLDFFNKITKGGLVNKSLNVALAGTGVGKSLFMCHQAAGCLTMGLNVLYITMEMSEEKIAERIDANLLNVNIKDIAELPRMLFETKVADLSRKTEGKFIIKEYPTASAHVGHFRALLSELALKKSFSPDIIFIDYLNICASSRYKGAIVNSYTYVKAIAEELRGLAVEFNLPIVSATQTTRSGYGNSDVDLTDTSESFGLPATADLMFALISTEELEAQNQIMVKQLKNRYNDPTIFKRFTIGIDRAKMKLYDVQQEQDSEAVANTTNFQPDFSKESQSKFSDFVV